MGVLFGRKGAARTDNGDPVVDHVPTEDEINQFLWPSTAGFVVLVVIKLCMNRGILLAETADPKSDPLGAELRKAVPVVAAALVTWLVFKLQPRGQEALDDSGTKSKSQ